jgi:hypothetical protein
MAVGKPCSTQASTNTRICKNRLEDRREKQTVLLESCVQCLRDVCLLLTAKNLALSGAPHPLELDPFCSYRRTSKKRRKEGITETSYTKGCIIGTLKIMSS